MVKAVFFDLYQTLIYYTPPREEELAKVIQRYGVDVTADILRRPIVSADDFIYEEHARCPLSKRSPEEQKELLNRYYTILLDEAGIKPEPELIQHNLNEMQKVKFNRVLFDDVVPSFKKLHQAGFILGVISNVDNDINPLLGKLGVLQFLKVVITSLECGYQKPQPQIFNTAAEKADVKNEEAMYIGDQYQSDVVGSSGAGMQGVLLDRNGYFTDDTEHMVIKDLNQLVEHLC